MANEESMPFPSIMMGIVEIRKCTAGARIECSARESGDCMGPWWRSSAGSKGMDRPNMDECNFGVCRGSFPRTGGGASRANARVVGTKVRWRLWGSWNPESCFYCVAFACIMARSLPRGKTCRMVGVTHEFSVSMTNALAHTLCCGRTGPENCERALSWGELSA